MGGIRNDSSRHDYYVTSVTPHVLKLLRPHQWTKNLFCLAGVIFGGRLFQPAAIIIACAVVAIFSAAASAMYIFNDIQDIERDRQHPKKRFRPLASGKVSVSAAAFIALFLALVALTGAYYFGLATLACLALYVAVNFAYSLKLKHLPLLDVSCIAVGFVLRLLAGVYALGDKPTAWIALCTSFLALFLGFAKRRCELFDLGDKENSQRPVLSHYTVPYLDSLVNSTATMTVMCYALFTATSGKNPSLVVTVPVVHYAIMHYKHLVMVRAGAEEPDRIVLQDSRIKLSIVIWLISYLVIFYGNLHFFR
ncbi:MAG: decaprenyl-phosphate phosphoribosyltransferase [Oscillatoria princeps RMCB-10]|nr:decaprenyl-phosphate phosphoribosyltransferase [Oscillatoria princeps RMCB-10]